MNYTAVSQQGELNTFRLECWEAVMSAMFTYGLYHLTFTLYAD